MRKKYKIVFAGQDPGGLNAIRPVIDKLKKDKRFEIKLVLGNQAYKLDKPDLIFTATSADDSIEKKLIRIAKQKKIPSISIIDFWSNYKIRFNKYLPDYILVIDEIMKKEMINQGFPKEKIFIIGSPFFDSFPKIKCKEKKNLVVFFSQPFSEAREVFRDIVETIERINPQKKIIIKFHPKCKRFDKFDKIIKNSKLRIKKEKKLSAEDLIKQAEIVTGINSIVLFQAAMLGRKVLSYQPNLKSPDSLISNRFGLSTPVYNKKELYSILKNIQKPKNLKLIKKYTKNKSTEKVINFIEGILKRKKIVCVIQARTGSTRLPRKVLLDLEGKPVLLRVVDRILDSKKIDQIVVATSDKKRDEAIVQIIKGYNPKVGIFQGSENDCLDRSYKAVKRYNPDVIIRITSDCPLIDPEIVDQVIDEFLDFNGDYVTNTLGKRTYPRGLDTEAFSFKALEKMWKEAKGELYRENSTLFIRKNPDLFKCKNIINPIDYSFHRWTLDEENDYKLIKIIYQKLYKKNPNFRMKDILELFNKNPELIKINQHIKQKNPHY